MPRHVNPFSFNSCSMIVHCTDVCGLYTAADVTMQNVQADCKAFDDATTCPDKELRIAKLKTKSKKVIFKVTVHHFPKLVSV